MCPVATQAGETVKTQRACCWRARIRQSRGGACCNQRTQGCEQPSPANNGESLKPTLMEVRQAVAPALSRTVSSADSNGRSVTSLTARASSRVSGLSDRSHGRIASGRRRTTSTLDLSRITFQGIIHSIVPNEERANLPHFTPLIRMDPRCRGTLPGTTAGRAAMRRM